MDHTRVLFLCVRGRVALSVSRQHTLATVQQAWRRASLPLCLMHGWATPGNTASHVSRPHPAEDGTAASQGVQSPEHLRLPRPPRHATPASTRRPELSRSVSLFTLLTPSHLTHPHPPQTSPFLVCSARLRQPPSPHGSHGPDVTVLVGHFVALLPSWWHSSGRVPYLFTLPSLPLPPTPYLS